MGAAAGDAGKATTAPEAAAVSAVSIACCSNLLETGAPSGSLPRAGEGAMPAPLSERMCQVILDKVFKQHLTYAVVAE